MSSTQDIRVGDVMWENISKMTGYIRYCSSQRTAAAVLQKLVEVKPGFDAYLRRCQGHQRVQGLPLSYYLLKPVKRVTEYPLLLEKLLKSTDKDHSDYYNLQKALQVSKELCEQARP